MKRILCYLVVALCFPARTATLTVTNTLDSGAGSLRQAILDANTTPGFDAIIFNIGPGGPQIISPLTALPPITDGVVISGATQPGGDGTVPMIELNGSLAGTDGLRITSGNCWLSGLAICGFSPFGNQILIENGGGNEIFSCYIGLTLPGVHPEPFDGGARWGIKIENSASNHIGRYGRNVIAANGGRGANIWIEGPASIGNVIEGNYIGTDPSGSLAELNFGDGIVVSGASSNLIGGGFQSAANVISGHSTNGVVLMDGAMFNRAEKNLIGTDFSGMLPVPNRGDGVLILNSSTNFILGHNVISANNRNGIHLESDGTGVTQGNRIENNFVGINSISGPLGNTVDGILLEGDSTRWNTIGSPATRNWIAWNHSHGIEVQSSLNEVLDNSLNFNSLDGANVSGRFNYFHDNSILQNTRDGARLTGSTNVLTGNLIAGNHHNGVTVESLGLANFIRLNSITTNDLLGIDLEDDLVTLNDPGDGDGGANLRQNFPVIERALHDDSSLALAGSFSGAANSVFTLDFYLNVECDNGANDGYGEGYFHAGNITISTGASGNTNFFARFPVSVSTAPGWVVTATATSESSDTSEFSACAAAPFGSWMEVHREDEGHVTLTWPMSSVHWQLQSRPLPPSNLIWIDVTNQPVANNNGRYQVTDVIVPAGRLYRLRPAP